MHTSLLSLLLFLVARIRHGVCKGCFLKESYVTLADGSTKMLQHIQIGDQVTSWDEITRKSATSTVLAVPSFLRSSSELVEIALPSLSIHATRDHPFWSRSRETLVSLDPNATRAEYGLEATLLEPEEELENEQQEPVRITGISRFGNNESLNVLVEVLTLCLWPFHWYYVGGTRVHNKGCFLKDSTVTLSDGRSTELQNVQVGDMVASWDDVEQRPAKSKVMAVPRFLRSSSDIVEIALPSVSLYATQDHPLWSKSRHSLVSLDPNRTVEEYGLHAEMLQQGEELENERQEGQRIVGIQRPLNLSATVEVLTLCLWPFHWYYVGSVRVHNKGCFLKDSKVALADGRLAELQHVQVGDTVSSWDEVAQRPAMSTVMAVPRFLRSSSELVEIAMRSVSVYATKDHPFWSRSRQSLASLDPNQTVEEYGLHAELLQQGEELENQRQEGETVVGIQTPFFQASKVEVFTLCLSPFHWYYIEGVRVHNKGCFMKHSKVTLADRRQIELQHVEVGDQVLSWDERLLRPVPSTVLSVPTFSRHRSDLMELVLPSASIYATHDHPFWSRSRDSLVSLNPSETLEEYALDALLLNESELLENEQQEAVNISKIQKLKLVTPLPHDVEVMTLCLSPHHWYYVEGVRVHNKGCFAPWTSVLMGDGSSKPIADVRAEDKVLSWDSEAGEVSEAQVIGIVTAAAEQQLFEISFNTSVDHVFDGQAKEERQLAEPQPSLSRSLVLTADHPIYSRRAQGLVSMAPGQTQELYGLDAEQMQSSEVLQHHLGHRIQAQVQPWQSNTSAEMVMTLTLDRHHWFFAEGVLVHNKGGRGGGGGHAGRTSAGRPNHAYRSVVHSRAMYHTPHLYASWILLHNMGGSRRRYGTYLKETDTQCEFVGDVERNASCQRLIGNASVQNATCGVCCDCCHRCIACGSAACMDSIGGCSDFLADVYVKCYEKISEGDDGTAAWIFILIVLLVGALGLCGMAFCKQLHSQSQKKSSDAARRSYVRKLRQERLAMTGFNPQGLSKLQLSGTYTENGETKPCFYSFDIRRDGSFSGLGRDDDGAAEVEGILSLSHDTVGKVWWSERRSGTDIEVTGRVLSMGDSCDTRIEIHAIYSSDQIGGNLSLASSLVVGASSIGAVGVPDVIQGVAVQHGSKEARPWADRPSAHSAGSSNLVKGAVLSVAPPSMMMQGVALGMPAQPVVEKERVSTFSKSKSSVRSHADQEREPLKASSESSLSWRATSGDQDEKETQPLNGNTRARSMGSLPSRASTKGSPVQVGRSHVPESE